ncbi:MAG: T9SS type A sorting domain-containing protein [bacterium]
MKTLFSLFLCGVLISTSYAEDKGTLLWSFQGSDRMLCVSSIRDVNGNGINDVLAGNANDTLYCFEGASQDSAVSIWKFKAPNMVVDVDSIPDVNGDGIPDVVLCSGGPYPAFCLSGADGSVIWRFTDSTAGFYTFVEPMGDVNGDGICDIAIEVKQTFNLYCIDGASKDTATILWEFPLNGYTNSYRSLTTSEDLDGDGIRDIIVCVNNGPKNSLSSNRYLSIEFSVKSSATKKQTSPENKIYCVSGKGDSIIWSHKPPETGDIVLVASISDISGNGIPEILGGNSGAGLYLFEGSKGNIVWNYPINTGVIVSINDVSGDSIPDILASIFTSFDSDSLLCIKGGIDTSANVLWTFRASHLVSHLDVIPDINGDSVQEVVAGCWNGYVYCLKGDSGTPIWSYSGKDTSDYGDIMGLTGIKDVNGDGFDDVVAVTYGGSDGGEVWCLSGKAYGIEEKSPNLDFGFRIWELKAEPNPFIQSTVISYSASGGSVKSKIQIYDIAGKLVEETKDNIITAKVGCSIGKKLKSGVYFVKVNDSKLTKIIKMGGLK